MSLVRGPFVKFKCGECGRWIERQISARNAPQEISDLCDGPQLYCAPCAAALYELTSEPNIRLAQMRVETAEGRVMAIESRHHGEHTYARAAHDGSWAYRGPGRKLWCPVDENDVPQHYRDAIQSHASAGNPAKP